MKGGQQRALGLQRQLLRHHDDVRVDIIWHRRAHRFNHGALQQVGAARVGRSSWMYRQTSAKTPVVISVVSRQAVMLPSSMTNADFNSGISNSVAMALPIHTPVPGTGRATNR